MYLATILLRFDFQLSYLNKNHSAFSVQRMIHLPIYYRFQIINKKIQCDRYILINYIGAAEQILSRGSQLL